MDARAAARALLLAGVAVSSLACYEDERLLGVMAVAPSGTGGESVALPAPLAPFGPPRLIPELSDPEREQYDAALSADKLQILYRSQPRRSPGEGRSEILMATRAQPDAAFGAPRLVEEIDAPQAWNLSPELSLDGLALWLSSDRATTVGGLDLWFAKRPDPASPWSIPENLSTLNTLDWDTDIGVDTHQLYMVFSRRADGQDAEMFSSSRASREDPWKPAEPLLELNSAADDWDAALANDGLTLLFASNRSPRADLTGLHIYEATRRSRDAPFSAPALVEELTATWATDEDAWLSNDGRHVVFTSTRDGRRHLYEAFR